MAKLENRYANALLALSEESGSLETELDQAVLVRDALDDEEVRAFLAHPHIHKQDKYDLFLRSFSGKIGDHLMGFLHLMIRRNRAALILPALAEYIAHANRRLGRTEARIVSAKPLSQQQIESIQSIITNHVRMQIEIKTAVDPDVIGGFYVLVDGRVFDATVRTELNKMKECLKRGGCYASQTR